MPPFPHLDTGVGITSASRIVVGISRTSPCKFNTNSHSPRSGALHQTRDNTLYSHYPHFTGEKAEAQPSNLSKITERVRGGAGIEPWSLGSPHLSAVPQADSERSAPVCCRSRSWPGRERPVQATQGLPLRRLTLANAVLLLPRNEQFNTGLTCSFYTSLAWDLTASTFSSSLPRL